MKSKKNLWMALLLVFTLMISGLQAPVFASDTGNQVSITVIGDDAANPLLAETAVPYGDNQTATESLLKAVGEDQVEFTDTDYGKMLTGIKGLQAEGTHYWSFFINGIAAQIGSDSYMVQAGDKITFRYTDWTKAPENTVSLKVMDSKKNIISNFSGIEVIGHPSAFQLLQVAVGPDKVGYTDTQYGKMITSINGIEAEGTNFWAFYADGQMALIGAESYQLQPGNEISFRLESWEPVPGDGNNGDPATPPPPTGTVSGAVLQASVDTASAFVLKNVVGEWEAIALKQAGKAIPATYLESVKAIVKEKQGKFSRITDTERYALGLLAAGGDPTNVEGYNLIEAIYNGNVPKQGLIGVSYALIALDSADFTVPDTAGWTREKLINHLVERQNADGGWAWDEGTTSDIDTTAMILTALAPYMNQANVKDKVDTAVQYLSTQYLGSKIDNSSTSAQVIIALSALGIDANGPLFTKENSGLVQYFMTFQNADGGFDWQGGDVSDPFTTSQALQAIVAYQLYTTGKGSLYKLPLVEQKPEAEKPETEKPEVETPNKEKPAQVTTVKNNDTKIVKGKALPDTATNMYNLLALGLLFMMIGTAFYLKQRKTKA